VIKSVTRGVQVLGCFTPHTPRLRLKDIADQLAIPMGSAFRTLRTLETLGFVVQDPVTKQYRLGLKALDLSLACLAGMEFPDVALPFLEELASQTRLSANMAVLDGTEIVFVARASVVRLLRSNLSVGSRLPGHCTAMGKVLLAHLEPTEARARLAGGALKAFTPRTMVDVDTLLDALKDIRAVGFAVCREELELHLTAVAVPVVDATGRAVAAINVAMYTGPGDDESSVLAVLPKLILTGAAVSSALGYRPGGASR